MFSIIFYFKKVGRISIKIRVYGFEPWTFAPTTCFRVTCMNRNMSVWFIWVMDVRQKCEVRDLEVIAVLCGGYCGFAMGLACRPILDVH